MHRNDYSYVYDQIGNLERSETLSGVEGVTNYYSANNLNQYTNIQGGAGSPSTPSYDADGNMVTNGSWTYTWNGENRMISASNASTVVTYAYDYMGRCYSKVKNGAETKYIWDGYNIIAEISPAKTNYNVWGLDLSGGMQGAGGVGGLLCVVENGSAYFSLMDGNGNICDYVDEDGDTVAHYEYSPFGGITVASESKADDFSHRFSTKPYDADTGLVRYELRAYSSELGRWPSRDPLGEYGGDNLYSFVRNMVVIRYDKLGLCVDGHVRNAYAEPRWTSAFSPDKDFALDPDSAKLALNLTALGLDIVTLANIGAAEGAVGKVVEAVAQSGPSIEVSSVIEMAKALVDILVKDRHDIFVVEIRIGYELCLDCKWVGQVTPWRSLNDGNATSTLYGPRSHAIKSGIEAAFDARARFVDGLKASGVYEE